MEMEMMLNKMMIRNEKMVSQWKKTVLNFLFNKKICITKFVPPSSINKIDTISTPSEWNSYIFPALVEKPPVDKAAME